MAQKARKDRAKNNASTLFNLHITSLVINLFFLAFSLLFRSRSLITYLVLSIPAFACQFILERSGRPSTTVSPNGTKTLKAGEDLSAEGLTEYMFDVVWVTWACILSVVVFGNWGWLLYAVLPVFAVWKGWGLLGAARGMMGGGQGAGIPEQEQVPQGNRRSRRVAA